MQNSSVKTRIITRTALLIAMAVVLKVFISLTFSDYRLTFYDIPLMIVGMMFGPLMGLIAGFGTDVANIVYPNLATGFNLMTISSMMWGFIPGLFLYKRQYSLEKLVLVVILTSVICFGINTVQLALWSNGASLSMVFIIPRVLTLFIKLPIQVLIIDILYARVILNDLKKLNKTYEAA